MLNFLCDQQGLAQNHHLGIQQLRPDLKGSGNLCGIKLRKTQRCVPYLLSVSSWQYGEGAQALASQSCNLISGFQVPCAGVSMASLWKMPDPAALSPPILAVMQQM